MGKYSEANPFSRSLDNNFFRFETEFLCLWPIILFWTVCIKWPDSLKFIEWVLVDCSNEHEKIIFNSFLTFQFHLMKAQFRVDSTLFIRIESNALSWKYQTIKTFYAPKTVALTLPKLKIVFNIEQLWLIAIFKCWLNTLGVTLVYNWNHTLAPYVF